MALRRKDAGKAVELLRGMSPHELGAQCLLPVYVRGQAYLMLHDGSAAAAEFQKMIDHPGIVEKCPVGALAHLGLARAYTLKGLRATPMRYHLVVLLVLSTLRVSGNAQTFRGAIPRSRKSHPARGILGFCSSN